MIVLAIPDDNLAIYLSEILSQTDDRMVVRRWQPEWAEADPGGVADRLLDPVPEVITMGGAVAPSQLVAIAAELNARRPDVGIVMLAEPAPRLLMAAMRAGVRDVVHPQAEPDDVQAVFERVLDTTGRLRTDVMANLNDPARNKRVVTLMSPRGGTGKTTIATNLALTLHRRNPGRVCLVDLDMHFGDVAGVMSLNPEHSMADAANTSRMLDETTLKVFLSAHHSGLYVMCAPLSIAEAEEIQPENLKNVLTMLTGLFDTVIFDSSPGLNDFTLTALEASTDLVLVATTHVPAVRALRREIEVLDAIGMTSQRRHFVLNRTGSRGELSTGDIAAIAGMEVSLEMPGSRAVPPLTNQGQLICEINERDPFAKTVEDLAGLIDPSTMPEPEMKAKKGRWR